MTLKDIARQKKCSVSTVQRLFREYLDKPPTPQIRPNDNCHLIIDGTYHSDFCLLNYFDADLKYLQYYEIVKKENYRDFELGLRLLKTAGPNIVSVTSDGEKELIMAIRETIPAAHHQRCLIHVQRMSLLYLTQFPKYPAGRELRLIIRDLHRITNHDERAEWVRRFRAWEADWDEFLSERSAAWSGAKLHTHYDIRRVRSLINNTLPNLFHYLYDPKIPKSTNGLECRFSYLKNNLRIHRGLSRAHRKSFLLWYNWFKYND